MNRRRLPIALAALLILAAAPLSADDAKPKPGEKRQLLSEHRTVATLTSIEPRKCRGLTSLCPDQCGHSGDFADFKIIAYLHYHKAGEYGNPQAETFTVQLQDNTGVLKLPKPTADALRALKPGDYVLLDWRHDYVTQTEPGGGSSSFPERPITKVQPITKAEADKLIKGN